MAVCADALHSLCELAQPVSAAVTVSLPLCLVQLLFCTRWGNWVRSPEFSEALEVREDLKPGLATPCFSYRPILDGSIRRLKVVQI